METEVVLSVFAEITALTVPVGIGGNPIARLKIPYIFTYLRDDPGSFVSQRNGIGDRMGTALPLVFVQICSAQSAVGDGDLYGVRTQRRLGKIRGDTHIFLSI